MSFTHQELERIADVAIAWYAAQGRLPPPTRWGRIKAWFWRLRK